MTSVSVHDAISNWIGIEVNGQGYTATRYFYISGATFTSYTNPLAGATSIKNTPQNNVGITRSRTGVYGYNIPIMNNTLNIGTLTNSSNIFDYLYCGIQTENANLTVRNCKFTHIAETIPDTLSLAIRILGTPSLWCRDIYMNNSLTARNKNSSAITNCEFRSGITAIESQGPHSAQSIQNNQFYGPLSAFYYHTGILINNNTSCRPLQVINNTMSVPGGNNYFRRGIYVANCSSSTIDISENRISNINYNPIFIKAISDFGDEQKNDSYHEYASFVSAQYAMKFIYQYF